MQKKPIIDKSILLLLSLTAILLACAGPAHIGTIEAAAPEIVKVGDQYYLSSTADYQGVKIAKLRWDSNT